MLIDPERAVAPHVTSRLAERVGLRYLCALLLFPAVCFVLPFIAERVPQLWGLIGTRWAQILEYGYNMASQNADIVLFGDSSALYGIDTARLSTALHLKVMNIPNTVGSLPVTRDDTLRRYLQTNRAPRLIVFVMAPWNLDVANQPNGQMFEGEEMLLRHGQWRQILQFARTRPGEFLQFPFRFYATEDFVERTIRSKPTPPEHLVQGHLDYDWGGPESTTRHTTLKIDCAFPAHLLSQRSFAFTRDLAKDYASTSTQTLVYLSAIPQCAHADEVIRVLYSGLGAAPPIVLPPHGFADDSYYVHTLPSSTGPSTDALATAIRHKLNTP